VTSFRIERFRWWHITEVMPLEEDLFGAEKWSEWMFWNELAGGHFYRIALDDDEAIAGYGGLAVTASDEAWVQNLAVRRDVQRHNIELFRTHVKKGQVLEMQDARHYILQSNTQEVLQAIEKFVTRTSCADRDTTAAADCKYLLSRLPPR